MTNPMWWAGGRGQREEGAVSGGSYDYAYQTVESMAAELEYQEHTTPLRQAFALLLYKVGKAMKDIEWVDSFDFSPGDEDAAIREALFFALHHDLRDCVEEKP